MKEKNKFFRGNQQRRLINQGLSLIVTVFLSQMLLQWFQNDLNISLVLQFTFQWHTIKFLISLCVLLVPAVWLWSLIGNVKIVNILFLSISMGIGFATFEKMRQRGEPLYPSDLQMLTNPSFLLEMLPPFMLILVVVGITVFFIGLVLVIIKERKEDLPRLKRSTRILLFLLSSFAAFYLSNFSQEGNVVKIAYDQTAYWIPYSQQMNYYNNGFVAGFLYNLPSEPMAEPDGYGSEGLTQLMEKYQEKAQKINESRQNKKLEANIIFVMNESFADPFDLKETSKKWDPIPFARKLAAESWSGRMLSQGYGGGTANIEFEALTGFSMEPFSANITTPFTQFLPKDPLIPSVVSRLKEEGYATTAIHPYNTSMYKRRENYGNLGFDTFYYDEIMTNTDTKENNPYISDKAAYQEVLQSMNKTEEYDFVHLVTMQNHTPYSAKYEAFPSAQKTGYYNERINQYFQDLVYSDQALEFLYEELEQIEEPSVVVFWGDHWPSVFGEEALESNGKETLHHTPVIMFNNVSKANKDFHTISPIYFFIEVLEMLDQSVAPFDALLMELQEYIPSLEKGMYFSDEQQGYVSSREELSDDAQRVLNDYDWVMFDVTTGNKQTVEDGFFERLD